MLKLNLFIRPKVFWPILIVLVIASITFSFLKEKEKRLKLFAQRQLAETVLEKLAIENELIATVRAKEILQKELTAEKKESLAKELELEEKERQIKLVLDKLEKEIIARRVAEIELITAMKEKRTLITRLREYMDTQASQAVELKKIVVKAVPELAGKVLVVNKEQAFVVVDLGKSDNLRIGDTLSVYRNGNFIGRVQVERVEEKVCVAAILPEWQDIEFKENDVVKGI